MAMQDSFERTIVLPVSRERAWRAITDPAQIKRWFGEVTMDFRPGGAMTFFWESSEHARARVAIVDPPRHFAYDWRPGSIQHFDVPLDELPLTLVESILDEIPEGTRLTLIETGFASLPAEMYALVWQETNDGWDEEIGHLAAYLTKRPGC